jgi:hypothetical protein
MKPQPLTTIIQIQIQISTSKICCKTKECKANAYKFAVLSKTKIFFQKVVKKKGAKMTYLLIVLLADISALINNPYTEFVLLDTNYNA